MNLKLTGILAAAAVAAAVPTAIVFAQAPGPQRGAGLSADVRARLLEGRLALRRTKTRNFENGNVLLCYETAR